MWDERYSAKEFAYGTEPNDFLVQMADRLPKGGRVLSLAEGEGRNAVYLATRGHAVTAVDASPVGIAKARRLAESRGVTIDAQVADLAEYAIEAESWDGVVSIFCHVPEVIRADLHRRVVHGLKPGGVLILEAYTPAQLDYGTGGPQVVDRTMTLDALRAELAPLEIEHGAELERAVHEGIYHTGLGAVVQVVARKPRS